MALLKVRDVAAELNVTTAAIYALAARGVLRTVHIGRALRIPKDAVADFIAQGGRRREPSGRREA
jgi:excisionase family DNA binding protein